MDNSNNNLILTDSRPTRSDAVKNRELLLETASLLFQKHGVEAVSMSQIAQEAGVGKGTLYRHFNNKSELCHALLDQDMRDLQAQTIRQLNRRDDPLETLRWFLRSVVSFVWRNEDLLLEASASEARAALTFVAHWWWRQTIQGVLHKVKFEGDLDYTSDVLYMMLDVNTIHFQRYNLGYDLQRISEGIVMTLERLCQRDGA